MTASHGEQPQLRSAPGQPVGTTRSKHDEELTVAEVFLEAGMELPGVAYLDAPADLREKIASSPVVPQARPTALGGDEDDSSEAIPGTAGPVVVLLDSAPGPGTVPSAAGVSTRNLTLTEVVSLASARVWAAVAVLSLVASVIAFDVNETSLHAFSLATAALAMALPSLTLIDIKVLRLPVVIVYPTAVLVALIAFASVIIGAITVREFGFGLATAAVIGGYHWLLHALTRSLGLGDVKLAALTAFVLGVKSPLLAMAAVVMAPPVLMIPVMGLMAARGIKQAPYGPALAAGAFIALAVPGVFETFLGPI